MKSLSDRVTEMGMEASWRVGVCPAFSVLDYVKGCELGARREIVRVRDSFSKLMGMWGV